MSALAIWADEGVALTVDALRQSPRPISIGSSFTTEGSSAFTPEICVSTAPLIQSGSIGVQPGGFGFSVQVNSLNVVEACSNLVSAVWVPLQTNSPSGIYYFSDPDWTNYATRFYRIRIP